MAIELVRDSDPKPELDHVRHDPMHVALPGLFRSIDKRRSERGDKGKKLYIAPYQFGPGLIVKVKGPDCLGADDLRYFQGLVALAGPHGGDLPVIPESSIGRELRLGLKPEGAAAGDCALVVRTSMRRLLFEIGMSNSGSNKRKRKSRNGELAQPEECGLRVSLERMAGVVMYIQQGTTHASFQMLSYVFDTESGALYVALNPMIRAAVAGGRHARIELSEVRALKSAQARLIHQRLCGFIRQGESHDVLLSTICGYVRPDEAPSAEAMKKRRSSARAALKELEVKEIGWKITEYAMGKFHIERPAIARAPVLLAA